MTTLTAREPVSRGWIARYGLMYLGQNIAWAAPSNLLLANQILIWFPDTKETMLGWLMAAGGLVSMVAGPLTGLWSDRTRSRFGRRSPWVLGGAVGAAASLLFAAGAGTLGTDRAGLGFGILVAAWMCFQFTIAATITPTQSIAPDRVPQNQFGTVSGVMGMTYTFGVVVGTAVAAGLGGFPAYVATVAILLVCPVPFLLIDRERPYLDGPDAAPLSSRGLLAMLPDAKAFPDFWRMFVTRTLLTLSQAIVLFFLLYFLRDRIHHSDPDTGVLILTGIYALCVVTTAVASGLLSDKAGRRKPFVLAAAIGVAAACALLITATTFPAVIVAAIVLGLAWGVYQAIDQALVNEVLPSEADRATHMGVMNLGVALPNTLAPVVAAAAVTMLGGYPGLYALAGALALIGGFTVTRIRSRA